MLNNKKGFTLLEVLLVIVLIGVLSGMGLPVYRHLQNRNDLDVATNTIVQTLRRAQTLARAVDGDASWGVYISAEDITLFQGTGYMSRDNNLDEVFDILVNISPSGLGEVVFAKFTGETQDIGTIILTSDIIDGTRNITINEKGTVDF